MRKATYEMLHDESAHELARRFEFLAVVAVTIVALYGILYHVVF